MRTIPVIVIALFNSLWQAGTLSALVWLALKFARSINAATRCAIWWIVLAVVVALPVVPRMQQQWRGRARRRWLLQDRLVSTI